MAIANSYPKATPKADDLILGTVTPTPNSAQSPVTRNFEIDALADLIISETSGITGSGTLNTIAMFTPDGQRIGDSRMTEIGYAIQVGTPNLGQATLLGDDFISTKAIGTTQLTADNITSAETGVVLVRGNMSIGDGLSTPDTLTILSRVEDANSDLGTAGQVLVSNASSQLEWTDIADISGTVTGSGTTNTIPIWTDGPNGVLGNSLITQAVQGQTVNVNTNLEVTDDFTVTGSIQCNSDLTVEGTAIFNGQLDVNGTVRDTNNDLGTDGQLLVSNAQSNVEWKDAEEVVSGAITKLIPFQVTASAGGSSTYSANDNIVEIGWTGGNGTYVLNIPSAATIPYRNIRFVTNSTFPSGASDKIEITAQAGETIDGAAFFEISKQYDGVSIWSNGTEWIVIQAKAH